MVRQECNQCNSTLGQLAYTVVHGIIIGCLESVIFQNVFEVGNVDSVSHMSLFLEVFFRIVLLQSLTADTGRCRSAGISIVLNVSDFGICKRFALKGSGN